jgi:hypothetical protein
MILLLNREEENDSHDPNIQEADIDSGNIETIVSITKKVVSLQMRRILNRSLFLEEAFYPG